MTGIVELLVRNRNYRYLWLGQVVSEIGDHFNTIAAFTLAYHATGSGMVVSGIMLARAVPMMVAGPLAGVALDRLDRRQIMVASDLVRAVLALAFILTVGAKSAWSLYLLSGLLMFASPFFTSGRASILPVLVSKDELHAANTLTQTTSWTTTALGALGAGLSVHAFGYQSAFVVNAASFVFSAWCVLKLQPVTGSFRAVRTALTESDVVKPWTEYREGLRYIRTHPLLFAISFVHIGWATGGGAAQILFTLFGESIYRNSTGTIWGVAGMGLVVGGFFANRYGKRLSFDRYRRTISICYILHGVSYIIFSQVRPFWAALLFIAISRASVAITSVLNFGQLLRHTEDRFRGRVFATMETLVWAVMMLSMMAAGYASEFVDARTIGAVAGALSSFTCVYWWLATRNVRGFEAVAGAAAPPEEVEVHGAAEEK